MYTEQELQWIQEFIDKRFDGIDASEEMISIMEKSGLLKPLETSKATTIRDRHSNRPKEVYSSQGELLEAVNLIS